MMFSEGREKHLSTRSLEAVRGMIDSMRNSVWARGLGIWS